MIVRLRLVGVNAANPDISQGGDLTLDPGSTVLDVITATGPDEPDHMAVFINGEQVEKTDWHATLLSQNDEIVLIRPLEGGTERI